MMVLFVHAGVLYQGFRAHLKGFDPYRNYVAVSTIWGSILWVS